MTEQGAEKMEQVVIMGAGPAGISAALYVKRAGLDPLVFNHGIGALAKAEKIENYYGLERPLSGQELFDRGIAQAKALGIRIIDTEVLEISGFDTFEIKTTAGTFEAVSVILASGSTRKSPRIKGLKELEGRGVSYCAICDAFFYRRKPVGVLGNSDYALHEARILSQTGAEVTVFTNGMEPDFSSDCEFPLVTAKAVSVEGNEVVTGILTEDKSDPYPIEGLFVALGTAGSTEIARQMGAELTEKSDIRVNELMESTIPGIFAAGDCTGGLLQVAKAVHDGAQAGLTAAKYVRNQKKA